MPEPTKLVVFDCDGTLVDSQHMIVGAMHETFREAQLPRVSDSQVRSIVGLSLNEAIAVLIPGLNSCERTDLVDVYKKTFYRLRVEQDAGPDPLYEGTREVLIALKEEGYQLGVATGNSKRGLARVIAEHDLEGLFVTLQTADGHPSKPHPSMIQTAIAEAGSRAEHTVMIGDTSYDMVMSVRAGTYALGVNWGYHSEDDLKAAGAKHIASFYNEVPSLVRAWIGNIA